MFLNISIFAQQSPNLTHFMFNKNVFNPSTIADGDELCVSAFYRSQWTGIDGAPVLMGVNAAMPKLTKNMGVGLAVYNDKLGKYNRIQIEGNYAYSIYLKDAIFSMGLKVGVLNMSLSDLNFVTPETEAGNDPDIFYGKTSSWAPNFGIGFQYMAKKWYVGFSILNLLEQNNSFDEVIISQKRQYYFTSGYTIRLNSAFKIIPNIMLRTDMSAYQFDLNVNAEIYENLIVGSTYRWQDSASILLGYSLLEDLKLYYSYDFGVNKIGSFSQSGGSHELSVKYCFSFAEKVKKSKKNRNVRFL